MSRDQRARIARETLAILNAGEYVAPSGRRVPVDTVGVAARARLLTPRDLQLIVDRLPPPPQHTTRFEVRNETTLAAARRLAAANRDSSGAAGARPDHPGRVLCLNFASARQPGGGFLTGAQAQEESLARSSALYAALSAAPQYYEENQRCGTALYTDHMILSPDVPVFRDDAGNLLEEPYVVSFLTAPAVNAGAVRRNEPQRAAEIEPVMRRRALFILAAAAESGATHLVLGAWGCGVFQNDPALVAGAFAEPLNSGGLAFGRFETVTFTVLDSTAGGQIIAPYERRFVAIQ